MVDQTPRYRPFDLDDIDTHDRTLTDRRVRPYTFELSVRTDSHTEDPVPAFLSDREIEPDPSEYVTPLRKVRRRSVSATVLAGVLATAAAAVLFAMFSSDAARDIASNAKALIAASVPAYASLQPDPAPLTARDRKDGARLPALASQASGVRAVAAAEAAPSPEKIKAAYQSARSDNAAVTPPAATAPDPPLAAAPVAALPPAAVSEPVIAGDAIHRLDPADIAAALRRADNLIASGDLAAARLVLRRAANAGDARAAMTLAGTYDPVILEKLGVHGFVPDVAMARAWYEKAKKFGSVEAPRRLELLASKRQ